MTPTYLSPLVAGDEAALSDINLSWGFQRHIEVLSLPVPGESVADLHALMEGVGMVVKWFRKEPYPHYRITFQNRGKALRLGAVQLSEEEFRQIKEGV